MHITKKTEYAILGALYVACQPRERFTNVNEITRSSHLPKDLLLKIFHDLVTQGILESKAGINGGFRLKKSPENTKRFWVWRRLIKSLRLINPRSVEPLAQIRPPTQGFLVRSAIYSRSSLNLAYAVINPGASVSM